MSTVPEVIEAQPGDSPVSPLTTTTITPVADTTLDASTTARSSASSAGSSNPMFSTGEATVIHVPDESNSTSTKSATVGSPGRRPPTIPRAILNLLNQLYTGLSYYDRLAKEQELLDFSPISTLIRSIVEGSPDAEIEDSKEKMASIAAEYMHEAEERDRETIVVKEEVAKKIDYVNEMVKERVELLQAKRGNITVDPAKDCQEEEDKEDHAEDLE